MSWHKLSGSERVRIKQILTRSGRYSLKQLAKRRQRKGDYAN